MLVEGGGGVGGGAHECSFILLSRTHNRPAEPCENPHIYICLPLRSAISCFCVCCVLCVVCAGVGIPRVNDVHSKLADQDVDREGH